MFDDFSRFDDLYGRDRDGRESGGEEREETIEKIKYKVTVTVYIYTVIVASLDINLQTFASSDACLFFAILSKFLQFFFFCILHPRMQLLYFSKYLISYKHLDNKLITYLVPKY